MSLRRPAKDQPESFEFDDSSFEAANRIIAKYPKEKKQSAVLPLLFLAQKQNEGWLSQKAIERVGKTLEMSFIRVMEVATFYSMFNLEPVGKNFIQICRTTPCWLKGSDKITKLAKKITGCDINQTSDDKLFTVVEVECLGACCNAPVVQINDDYFEDLNEDNFKSILENLKNGKKIKTGSQTGRISSKAQKIL